MIERSEDTEKYGGRGEFGRGEYGLTPPHPPYSPCSPYFSVPSNRVQKLTLNANCITLG
jgi:hypothetical protein